MNAGRFRVLALMLADLACIMLTFLFVAWSYRAVGFGHYKFGLDFYLNLWPSAIAYVATNSLFRLYHGSVMYPAAPVGPVEEFRRLVGSSVIVHLGTLAALALAHQTTEHYSRAVILISAALTAMLAQPVRDLVRKLMKRLGVGQIPIGVVGSDAEATRLISVLAHDAYTGFRTVPDGTIADIALVCGKSDILSPECRALCERYRHVEFVRSSLEFPFLGARFSSVGGAVALEAVNQRKMSVLRAEKRVLDMALAAVAFLLTLPLFVVIAVLVKLTSRGPVFYRHRRLGKMGRVVSVWKFRSMYEDADRQLKDILTKDAARRLEWESNFKLADDPRVTPFGRFLRRTSLDELPQFFNVFVGDMALVGPRPIVEKEIARYGAAYETFASVRPGITGLWQVSGRSDTDYASRVALDVQYVLNWSPWMDIWILFRTVYAVLFMRGAR